MELFVVFLGICAGFVIGFFVGGCTAWKECKSLWKAAEFRWQILRDADHKRWAEDQAKIRELECANAANAGLVEDDEDKIAKLEAKLQAVKSALGDET